MEIIEKLGNLFSENVFDFFDHVLKKFNCFKQKTTHLIYKHVIIRNKSFNEYIKTVKGEDADYCTQKIILKRFADVKNLDLMLFNPLILENVGLDYDLMMCHHVRELTNRFSHCGFYDVPLSDVDIIDDPDKDLYGIRIKISHYLGDYQMYYTQKKDSEYDIRVVSSKTDVHKLHPINLLCFVFICQQFLLYSFNKNEIAEKRNLKDFILHHYRKKLTFQTLDAN